MLEEIYTKYILKYYKIVIMVVAIVIVSSVGFFLINHYTNKEELKDIPKLKDIVIDEVDEELEDAVDETYYYIDLKGAVTNPGVYRILEGQRVIDVITLAGGLTAKADTSVLNLSKKVYDEMIIIIYTKDEIIKFKESGQTKEEVIIYLEKECKCPDPNINGACIDNETSDNNSQVTSKVSINTSSKEELMTLTSIGETKAQNIIDYRNNNGPFVSIEDIKNVSGIGESIFDKIKDYITI